MFDIKKKLLVPQIRDLEPLKVFTFKLKSGEDFDVVVARKVVHFVLIYVVPIIFGAGIAQ